MDYKLQKAELIFDKDGLLSEIITTAEMPGNPSDVRTIQASRANLYWAPKFGVWNDTLQEILQRTTAHGSEI